MTLLLFCFLCLNEIFSDFILAKATEDSWEVLERNVLLLLDISGSMNEPIEYRDLKVEVKAGQELTRREIATEWAQNICATLAGSDILFSTGFFSEYCCFLDSEKSIQVGDSKVIEQFDHIVFNGKNTNQYNALLAAEEKLEGKEGRKYIVLISDADPDPVSWNSDSEPRAHIVDGAELDYNNLNLKQYVDNIKPLAQEKKDGERKVSNENQRDVTMSPAEEEIRYINNFKNKCLELVNNKNEDYRIILVGLGKNVGLYKGLDEESDKIKCYNNQTDLENLKKVLLDDTGIDTEALKLEKDLFKEGYSFEGKEDYERCIIYMKYTGSKKKTITRGDFKLYCDGKECQIDNENYIGSKAYIYMSNLQGGKYFIDFSIGGIEMQDVDIEVQFIKECRIKMVELILVDGNRKECTGKKIDDCIFYDLEVDSKNKEYKFNRGKVSILVKTDVTKPPTGTKVTCYYKEIEDLEQVCDWDLENETGRNDISNNFEQNQTELGAKSNKIEGQWNGTLKVEAGKSYVCKAVIDTDFQEKCVSNAVCFTVPEEEPIRTSNLDLKIIDGIKGKCISAQEYITVDLSIEELKISWEERILVENGVIKENVEVIQVNERYGLCFQKEGDYILEIFNGKELSEIVQFHIENDNHDRMLVIIGIVCVLIIVTMSIYMKQKKK